jgi:hypothetical protein
MDFTYLYDDAEADFIKFSGGEPLLQEQTFTESASRKTGDTEATSLSEAMEGHAFPRAQPLRQSERQLPQSRKYN